MASLLSTAGLFVVVLSAFVGYIYLYGLPSATKRRISDAAVNAMGDSKSIDMVKDALRKIPDSDHSNLKDVKEDVKGDVKKHVGEGAPGTIQNPFGDIAAESAEKATNLAKERGAGTGPISG